MLQSLRMLPMTTFPSNQVSFLPRPDGSHIVWIPVEPVPASRPRVTRQGRVYYGKRYTAFRKQVETLKDASTLPDIFPLSGWLTMFASFYLPSPKKTNRLAPRGDVDNYFKTLDSFNRFLWFDDDQIVCSGTTKQYGDTPGILIGVKEVERIPETRALSQVWE